jgi:hypothetical protein
MTPLEEAQTKIAQLEVECARQRLREQTAKAEKAEAEAAIVRVTLGIVKSRYSAAEGVPS